MYYRLIYLREDNCKTQKEIADILEISEQLYNKYESGVREISMHLAIRLARYYNVSLDYIAGIIDNKISLN